MGTKFSGPGVAFVTVSKVLTNVWTHKMFKFLAYVDTRRVMNTKMLADTQRKLLNLKLFINSHSFWENTQLLKTVQGI